MTAQTIIVQDHSADLAAIRAELATVRRMLESVTLQPRPAWMNVRDYAAHIGKSPRTVTRMIDAGKLATKHIAGIRMVKV
jgi:hypothetical protein